MDTVNSDKSKTEKSQRLPSAHREISRKGIKIKH